MNSRTIGRITSVSQKSVIADICEGVSNYINTADGIRFVGEVGSYVSIHDVGRTIIGEITQISEKPVTALEDLAKAASDHQIGIALIGEISDRRFRFGVSKMPLIFSDVDIISAEDLRVMLEVSGDEEPIGGQRAENAPTRALLLPIGTSVIFPDYQVKVNIDRFFGAHFAVFGNTGAGKSNTIAAVIQNIYKKKRCSACGSRFVVIDSNGEYADAFARLHADNPDISVKNLVADASADGGDRLEIPVWALTADDWAVLLHASEKTQVPVLRRAVRMARVLFDENVDVSVKDHIIAKAMIGVLSSSDSPPAQSDKLKSIFMLSEGMTSFSWDTELPSLPGEERGKPPEKPPRTLGECFDTCFGRMRDFTKGYAFLKKHLLPGGIDFSQKNEVCYDMKQFDEAVQLTILYEGSSSSQRIYEYTATLRARLESLQEGPLADILTKTGFPTLEAYLKALLGESQVVNIDISMLDDATGEVAAKVVGKLLLDHARRQTPRAGKPVNFIIEEAHRFIRNEPDTGALNYNIFERIAREGRKFGLLLGISSQRPSELSHTVVSQCSNFVIHRVQNPEDLAYISKMVPYISQRTMDRLTCLPTGSALVFGTAINLPALASFRQASPATNSANARISEKWYVPAGEDAAR